MLTESVGLPSVPHTLDLREFHALQVLLEIVCRFSKPQTLDFRHGHALHALREGVG